MRKTDDLSYEIICRCCYILNASLRNITGNAKQEICVKLASQFGGNALSVIYRAQYFALHEFNGLQVCGTCNGCYKYLSNYVNC